MRSIRELLQLMINYDVSKGLCLTANTLWVMDIFTGSEYYMLSDYIHSHRPFGNKIRRKLFSMKPDHWWRPGRENPRIKWIKKHIKRLS